MTMQYYYSLLLVTTHTRLVVPKACIIPSDGTRLFDNSKYVKFYLSLNLNLIPAKSNLRVSHCLYIFEIAGDSSWSAQTIRAILCLGSCFLFGMAEYITKVTIIQDEEAG